MMRAACCVFGAAIVLGATPADAELAFFTSGRVLSITSHRVEGDMLVLRLRGGGEIVCGRSIVTRIGPDEMPYPETPRDDEGAYSGGDRNGHHRLESGPSAFDPIIRKAAAAHGVDAALVHAVIQVESAYQPRARSIKGAMGLMQLMPATARQYRLADPYDPGSNIEAGIRHLRSLLDRFPLALALAAYNAGERAVEQFRGIPPYAETRNYVNRVLALAGR